MPPLADPSSNHLADCADPMRTDMFSDDVLDALGAWQRGWQADDARKKPVTDDLLWAAAKLPDRFRSAPQVCFRKRFLFPKDLEQLVMFSGLDDGVASWTTDRDFAMDFKGLLKPGAPTAVFFAHRLCISTEAEPLHRCT